MIKNGSMQFLNCIIELVQRTVQSAELFQSLSQAPGEMSTVPIVD